MKKRETRLIIKPIHSFSIARWPSVPRVRSTLEEDEDPLAAFFAFYSPFKYNSYNPSHVEYQRLCAFSGWPSHKQQEHHYERERAWEGFRIAMVKAFNVTFGNDENDIEAWGRMCELVRMENIPDTLEARREVSKPFSFWVLIQVPLRSLYFLHRGTFIFCEKEKKRKERKY